MKPDNPYLASCPKMISQKDVLPKCRFTSGTKRLLDKYSVASFLDRFVSNYLGFDVPHIDSNTEFSG